MTKKHQNLPYEPSRCWVGDNQKISYQTKEEAEAAALVAEYDHNVKLTAYKCEYGNHWHLASIKHKRS